MWKNINGADLYIEILGEGAGKPVLIAHHGGGGIGSFHEPKETFGPLSDIFQVVVFDARGCGVSEAVPPYSHEQWRDDVDEIRKMMQVEKIVIAGGSYGGFIALEYAVHYPDRVSAMILRDTSADNSNFDTLVENAKNQDRVEINWENFHRYWGGTVRDDVDLKNLWAELIPLYDHDYDPVASAIAVEKGFYRHESHNWCFIHNTPNYNLKPQLHLITAPTLVTVGRTDWVTPVAKSEEIAALIPNSQLVIFENSGHSPQREEAELFQKTMRDFLATAIK